MAKGKGKEGVHNKHLHARISYLRQAATYLTVHEHGHGADVKIQKIGEVDSAAKLSDQIGTEAATTSGPQASGTRHATLRQSGLNSIRAGGLPLHLATHLRQVALKSQIRLHTNVKHSVCKVCSTVLIEGETCSKDIENLSRGGKKPHADVLVIVCKVCSAARRYPIGARRQRRKGDRVKATSEQQQPNK